MEVFVAILLVILALLAVRIGVAVEYTDSLLVRLKIFGFKIRLYPRKKAKKKSGKSSGSAQNSGTVKNKKEKKAGASSPEMADSADHHPGSPAVRRHQLLRLVDAEPPSCAGRHCKRVLFPFE